ncbi:hypothetical protein BDZ45DRAFT_750362 [Acephala macrosclerotiorum]|nr:hypothetical protein BDZ45DRAFT_750362 [Acephala macrosclerotiorum]
MVGITYYYFILELRSLFVGVLSGTFAPQVSRQFTLLDQSQDLGPDQDQYFPESYSISNYLCIGTYTFYPSSQMSDSASFIFNWHNISPANRLRFPDLYSFHARRVNLRTLSDAALRVFRHVLPGCEEIDSEILNNRPYFLTDEAIEFLPTTDLKNLVYYAEMLRQTDGSENNTIEEPSAQMNALPERPDLLPEDWGQQRAAFWGATINPQDSAHEEDVASGPERRGSLAERMRALVPQALGLSRRRGNKNPGEKNSESQTTPSASTFQYPSDPRISHPTPLLRDIFSVSTNRTSPRVEQGIRPTRPRTIRRNAFHRPVELPSILGTSSIPQPPPDDRPLQQRGTPYLVQTSSHTQPVAATPRFIPPRVGAPPIPGTSSCRPPPPNFCSAEQRGTSSAVRPSPNAQSSADSQGSLSRPVGAAALAKVRAFGKRAASQSANGDPRPPRRKRVSAVNRGVRIEGTEMPDTNTQQVQSYQPSGTPRELQHASPPSSSSNIAQGDVEMEIAEDPATQDTTNTQQTQSKCRLPSGNIETQTNGPGIEEGRRLSFQELVEVQAELPPRYGPSPRTAPPVTFPRPALPPVNLENTACGDWLQQIEEFNPFTPLEHPVPQSSDRPHLLPPPMLDLVPDWLLRPPPNSGEFGERLVVNRDEDDVSLTSSHTLENDIEVEMVEDQGVKAPPPTPVERQSQYWFGGEETRTDASYERPTFQEIEHVDSNVDLIDTALLPPRPSAPTHYSNNSPCIGRVEIDANDATTIFTTAQHSEYTLPLLPPPALPLSTESASQTPANLIRSSPYRPPLTRRNASRDIRAFPGDSDNEADIPIPPQYSPADINVLESSGHSEPPVTRPPSYRPSSVPVYPMHLASADGSFGLGHHAWTGGGIIPGTTPQNERRDPFEFAVGEMDEEHFDENGEWVGTQLTRERARTVGDLLDLTERGRTPDRVRMGYNMVSPYPRQEEQREPGTRRRLSSWIRQRAEARHEGAVRRSVSVWERFWRRSRNQGHGAS